MSLVLGAHRSTAGGLERALDSGMAIGCQAVQIFTASPRQWQRRVLTDAQLERWFAARLESAVETVVAHDSYLINLAAADPELRARSVTAYIDELQRCTALGIGSVVMHPGSPGPDGEDVGLQRVAEALRSIYEHHPDLACRTLLETTAGQGAHLGHRFEHLARLLEAIDMPERTGLCLDTCHLYAAGYDLRNETAYLASLTAFEACLEPQLVEVIHLNDSKGSLGSRVDRHEQIGEGEIGDAGFRCFLTDSRFAGLPMIVETPDLELHGKNLKRLRRLARTAGTG